MIILIRVGSTKVVKSVPEGSYDGVRRVDTKGVDSDVVDAQLDGARGNSNSVATIVLYGKKHMYCMKKQPRSKKLGLVGDEAEG